MYKHQQRFGLDIQFSTLVHNFNFIFSIGHLYWAGRAMNSLPSQILNVGCYVMRPLIFIIIFCFTISFYARGNMDCIYTASKSGITIRFTSPCSGEYQSFLDSFVNQLANKISRVDTSYKILVLINFEFLYYDFSGSPDYFTSIGVDTLRELNSDFISRYCYGRYGSTDQSRPNPLDINATDDKRATKEIGVKIIYNIDYRKKINISC